MHSAAAEPKQFLVMEGGHNDGFLMTGARYQEGLRAFLDSLPESTRGDSAQTQPLY